MSFEALSLPLGPVILGVPPSLEGPGLGSSGSSTGSGPGESGSYIGECGT